MMSHPERKGNVNSSKLIWILTELWPLFSAQGSLITKLVGPTLTCDIIQVQSSNFGHPIPNPIKLLLLSFSPQFLNDFVDYF